MDNTTEIMQELKPLPPHVAFTFGMELGRLIAYVDMGMPFDEEVMTDNRKHIERYLKLRGARYELTERSGGLWLKVEAAA